MRSSASVLVATAAALALAVPVHAAGNADAPGLLKKQDSGVNAAPAPTAAPAPAPAAPTATTTPQQSNQTAQTKSHATLPQTKGTVKKVTNTSTASAPSTTATQPTRTVRHHVTRSTSPSVTRTRAHTTQRASRSPASSGSASRGSSTADKRAKSAASPESSSTLGASHGRKHAARKHRSAPVQQAGKKQARGHVAPLTSISRAADRVIEVIPGALVLALAGLCALVFVLILRSWTMERSRGKALTQSYGVTVEALATAIEAKDHTTGGHIERVRRLGLLLAAEIAPRDARDPQMAYGFLLHDIGKLAVPDAILRAPGRLSEEQWALMRRHPLEGVRMLERVPFLDRALDVVRHHHERWDGGGYPDGLRGTEIPLWARIFSVVDALDAMTADRPYRPGRAYAAALDEIRLHAGTQFDPAVVEALERLDPAAVEPLLEPTQLLDHPGAPVVDLDALIPA